MNKLLITGLLLIAPFLYANNAQTVERGNWEYNDFKTLETSNPTNLRFLKYYDLLPDEINLKIFDEQDLSHLSNRKIYIGYGVADKEGNDCKIFRKEDTGLPNDTTVCLPWWRIERTYKAEKTGTATSFLDSLKTPKPPLTINYCKEYSDGKVYPGGTVVCTTYFDKTTDEDCWNNPEQAKCFVDNCGQEVKNKCTYLDSATGETTTLPTAVNDSTNTPQETQTKIKLTSHRYDCPSGPLVSSVKCVNEENVMIFPYECKEDDPNTLKDDGEYVYCDENSPNFNASGSIESFNGRCSDGSPIVCPANRFENTTKICTQPIYETEFLSELRSTELVRNYNEVLVDVLSGEPDIYSANENCLRSNTVEDARKQELYVKIIGNGFIDDDIYVLRHLPDGSHTKVYCNMQHAETLGMRKNYNGDILQCINNDGNYAFNQTVPIETTDIVTVQQNSENENQSGTPFALGRNHYGSTKVTIDGIEVAPNTFESNFPYYPKNSGWLRTWDNTTATFSILFPFAGAYEIFFYNKNNEEMARQTLDMEDFRQISMDGSIQLKLGQKMKLASGIEDDIEHENGTKTLRANREDMWVEWGGGVFGGRHSVTGQTSSSPKDAYVKNNAVYKVIVKDLLTGAITPIPMVYPLPYPNRVFISKLKVYEYRKYRCYNEFDDFNILGETSEIRHVCSNTQEWHDFENGIAQDIGTLQQWDSLNLCEQNCRTYNECTNEIRNEQNGFTCTQRGGENIGGDIEGNFFSSKDSCDAQCWTQNSCEQYAQSNCTIVDEQLSEPVSDFTGKTLFRKKAITYNCETRQDKQVGCAEYKVETTSGDIDYSFNAVGFETKDYSGEFEDAVTKAHMMEVGQQHIFSGWKGKCVYGKKWDFSYLSDPLTIASYAMSIYSSVEWLGNDVGVQWAKDMSDGFDSYVDSVSESIDNAWESIVGSGGTTTALEGSATSLYFGDALPATTSAQTEIANGLSDQYFNFDYANDAWKNMQDNLNNVKNGFLEQIGETARDTLKDYTGINWTDKIEALSFFAPVTQGDLVMFGARTAFILAAPSEKDYTLADRLLKGYSGIGGSDQDTYSYNSCMASIGASLPNLIGWSVNSVEHASEQLLFPWQHPLRMTPEQMAAIASVTSEKYMTSQFLVQETDNILLNVVAITPAAYLKATQTICMGTKVSQAASHIQSQNGGGGGMDSGAIALAVAKAAIGIFCPPCSFAMTIVMDLANNVFAKIDTCKDEEDAIQWGMLDFKTNQFLNKEQCHHVKTVCDKEVNLFLKKICVRHRKEYCCYDQIITKIFAEGLKEQLNKGWESCNDISVNDLKDVSFRECRNGEIAHINKCFPSGKFSEFQQVLFRQASKNIDTNTAGGLMQQALDSMAISKEQQQ